MKESATNKKQRKCTIINLTDEEVVKQC